MENSKTNFEALVAKMEALKETEQGMLKGGFSVLDSSNNVEVEEGSNYFQCSCTNNVPCGKSS